MSDIEEEWIDNLEHECEYFNTVPNNIRITFIHLTKIVFKFQFLMH